MAKRAKQPKNKSKKTKKPKSKGGRPTKYKAEYEEQAYKLCLLGATDEEMADFFGVEEKTINNWKKVRKGFLQSIKRGKRNADANVAESLYKRACGYEHPDVHISNYQGDITITDITKHYPPDTAACFIWLKNRADWKDKRELTGPGGGSIKAEVTVVGLLRLIDGSSKGKLPTKQEIENAG